MPFRAIPCRSVPFRSVPCGSVPCRALPCRSIPFLSVPYTNVCAQGPAQTMNQTPDPWTDAKSNSFSDPAPSIGLVIRPQTQYQTLNQALKQTSDTRQTFNQAPDTISLSVLLLKNAQSGSARLNWLALHCREARGPSACLLRLRWQLQRRVNS